MIADEDLGELIWAFIKTPEGLETIEEAVRAGHVSGIWLLSLEMGSPVETATLINRISSLAPRPLLVGVDAEAGMGLVMRGATELPTAMALGATGDPELARLAGAVTAVEASACGINVVAAPVLDVNINPANPIVNTRSFGSAPDLVSALGVAYLQGLQEAETPPHAVMAIGKHFPGHGDTAQDSHLELAAVDASRSRLHSVELPPFQAAIGANVAMLMTAHVAYPTLDSTGMPATLSRPILTDLLRDALGFRGALVTDALDMYAISRNFAMDDAAVAAVEAGNDLLLTDQWDLVYGALETAQADGRLTERRVREAVERVAAAKGRIFGSEHVALPPIDPDRAASSVGTHTHQEVADRIAQASITLVDGSIPPRPARPLLLATHMSDYFGQSVEVRLRAALADIAWGEINLFMLRAEPDNAQMQAALARAHSAGWVALLDFNRVQSFHPAAVRTSDALVSLVRHIANFGIPTTIVSMGSPYAVSRYDGTMARLCCYGASPASIRAALAVLMGRASAPGRLPVTLA